MAASFSLSEFSELVSTALDTPHDYGLQAPGGGDGDAWDHKIHLHDTPLPTTHKNKLKKRGQSSRNVNKGLTATFPSSTDSSFLSTNTSPYRTSFYTTYPNSVPEMLIISPHVPGPFPPPVHPILSASMSTVDLSANCLSLGMGHSGCGGNFSKHMPSEAVPVDSEHATNLASGIPTSTLSPSTPTNHRPRPLALLAKIKRQLSKSNVGPGSNTFPENAVKDGYPERPRALSLSAVSASRNQGVASVPAPSPNSILLAGATSNFDVPVCEGPGVSIMSNNISAPPRRSHQNQRPRRRSSSSESVVSLSASMAFYSCSHEYARSASALSAPWAYSSDHVFVDNSPAYVDDAALSIIGSAASFFAAVNRGKDGRTARRGSEMEEDGGSELPIHAVSDGHLGFSAGGGIVPGRTVPASTEPEGGMHAANIVHGDENLDAKVDSQLTQSYMPYLPLAMQLERKQQGLKTRVSVEDITSLAHLRLSSRSRTSLVPSSANREHELHQHSTPHVRTRKHIPPPLQATPSTSPASIMHPYAAAVQHPYSPTSTASSHSPVTPCTPFFTASEASLEDEDDDNGSRISSSVKGGRMVEGTLDKASDNRFSNGAFGQTLLHNESTRVHVHVLPPTPTVLGRVPRYANSNIAPHQIACQAPCTITVNTNACINIIDVDPVVDSGELGSHKQRTRSTSKPYKSPPMSPPPSGPLPVPPASSPSGSIEKRKATSVAHHRSLSPERSREWVPRHNTLSLTRTLSHESRFWDDDEDDEDDDMITSGDASFVSVPSTTPDVMSSSNDQNPLDVQPFSFQAFLSADSSTGHSEYASFGTEASSIRTFRSRELLPEASQHADIFGARYYHPNQDVIGIGRKQVALETNARDGVTRAEAEVEWTLGLGMRSSLESSRRFSSHALDAVLKPSAPMNARSAQTTTQLVREERIALSPPVILSTKRERTQSESALKPKSRTETKVDTKRVVTGNEDWTLSLPLPAAARGPSSLSPLRKISQALGEPQLDVKSVQDSILEDTISTADYHSVLDLGPRESTPSMEVEQVVICVPRIVTTGSGIENGSRSRIGRSRPQPTVFEASEEEEEGILRSTDCDASENLAKLDALSADLDRFNEMLRIGGSELRRSTGSRYGYAAGLSSSPFLSVPKPGRSNLKHRRSCGVLEVDEPPPKNAIFRTASFGNLFDIDRTTTRANARDDSSILTLESSPTPVFTFHTPLDDNSPILPNTEMYALVTNSRQGESSRPSSSSSSIALLSTMATVSGRHNSFSFNSSRNSTCTIGSTLTAKPRAGDSNTALLGPESAVISEISQSTASGNDHSDSEISSENDNYCSEGVPVISESQQTDASCPQPSIPLKTTTPTKSNLCPLTILTTPPSSPSRTTGSRRMSTSSVSSKNSEQSSSSLTPTLSPAYDSTTYPTPLASSSPAPPPSHLTASLFGDIHPVLPASNDESGSSVKTPERKKEPSSATPSPKTAVPSVEDRIRRLRELGMDAVTTRKTRIGVSPSSGNAQPEKPLNQGEIDGVSIYSDDYYTTARSSFTSTR